MRANFVNEVARVLKISRRDLIEKDATRVWDTLLEVWDTLVTREARTRPGSKTRGLPCPALQAYALQEQA